MNVWEKYGVPGVPVVTTVNEGDKVKLIRREGDGVLIETRDCKRGWMDYGLIQELN